MLYALGCNPRLEQLKISIHPLFFALGILSAFFGGLGTFAICVLTALLHECGHIFYAQTLGYSCKKISLMPYGASALFQIDGISYKDEIILALAGPLTNALVCVACAGLWWFFPQTYAFTDLIMQANLAMLAVNVLPAHPLDGGRVLACALKPFVGEKVASIVLKCVAVAVAVGLIVAYFTFIKNASLLILCTFLIFSCFERGNGAVVADFSIKDKLKGGLPVKYVLVDSDVTFKRALRFLDSRKYLILQLYDGDCLQEMTQDELYQKLLSSNIYDKVF